ncbi:MAG: hypothetical protein WDO69_30370 [Pseudomonadota bacterium]
MTALSLTAVGGEGFQVTPVLIDFNLRLVFTGSGDMNATGVLSEYLKLVHGEALRLALAQVSCDFKQLTFMNSSCFKSFVVWIDTVKNSQIRYQIAFLTNPSLPWQRRSLEALRRLAANLVTIETIA